VFHPLSSEQIRSIAGIQVQRLRERLEDRGFGLRLDESAVDHLARVGFDPVYGARPLKRLLQTAIADPLALAILDGTFRDGDTVRVSVDRNELAFENA